MLPIMQALELIKDIVDPRMPGKIKHGFCTIVFTTLCGILSGCESWEDIYDYCEVKQGWLSNYVDLSNGIPSEWTFRRLFTKLDSGRVEWLLRTLAQSMIEDSKPSDQIAIDGKALAGSRTADCRCLYSVSAWCHENGLVLGEEQVAEKSNEITAIPLLINSLELKGSTVSIDAAGCQKSITQLIRDKKGHYVLGLKKNHKHFYNAVKSHIEKQGESDKNRLYDAFEHSHGRSVRRRYFGYDIQELEETSHWADAKSVVAVETIWHKNNDTSADCVQSCWRYYLSSHKHNNESLPNYVRNHWGIENKLHWVLDVHMKEDDDQKSERKSVRSFALLRRIALNIVRTKDKTPKRSIKRKLRRAAMDNEYLLGLLM
jgi:predicted transposase YbfD/YdcC